MERDAEAEIDHALFPPGADGRAGGAQITHPAVGEVHDRREGDVPPDADVVARADSAGMVTIRTTPRAARNRVTACMGTPPWVNRSGPGPKAVPAKLAS